MKQFQWVAASQFADSHQSPDIKGLLAAKFSRRMQIPFTRLRRTENQQKSGPTLAACKNCECSKPRAALVFLFMRQRLLLLLFILRPKAPYKRTSSTRPSSLQGSAPPNANCHVVRGKPKFGSPRSRTTGTARGKMLELSGWEMGENLQLRFEHQHFWQQIKFACVFERFSLTKGVRGRQEWKPYWARPGWQMNVQCCTERNSEEITRLTIILNMYLQLLYYKISSKLEWLFIANKLKVVISVSRDTVVIPSVSLYGKRK